MNINPIVLSIPIYFLLIGIELLIQAFSKQNLYRLNDAITNISCGITQQVTGVFLKIVSITAYQLLFEHFALTQIPVTWWSVLILLFAVDFCYYWAHRMSHEVNLFWGGHVVHHQSEDYNFSVALRQGSFQVIWTFMFSLPLAIIGFDTLTFVTVSAIVTVYQFWIHTETIGKLGPIEWIFNTPSHHRVHHGRNPKYIDKNHAGMFIIWDRMFGTFQEEEERPTYGITKPVNSWNPVWVNLQHYAELWQSLKQARNFGDKMKMLFNKPGWFPEYLGGVQSVPEVDPSKYSKYDTRVSYQVSAYILVQYITVLGATAFYLFQEKNFAMGDKVLLTVAIILTIVNCGVLFERKSWVAYTETLRLLALPALVAYFLLASPLLLPAVLIAGIFSLISGIWLAKAGLYKMNSLHTA
ncbi:sterol desaturase family protein [Cytophagales bacterium LB-30]|uniref:Sterol desaturase family protein n=1 Tax=Shiella aurantiaca TaxID=3058365 RepID=A0ABT8F0Y1_9BACT|nr:sterol desaturase family protein [Shiella aurantiaca]MDN4164087.1 sterol desaturase family protein [Shiella aurantiaca]